MGVPISVRLRLRLWPVPRLLVRRCRVAEAGDHAEAGRGLHRRLSRGHRRQLRRHLSAPPRASRRPRPRRLFTGLSHVRSTRVCEPRIVAVGEGAHAAARAWRDPRSAADPGTATATADAGPVARHARDAARAGAGRRAAAGSRAATAAGRGSDPAAASAAAERGAASTAVIPDATAARPDADTTDD